MRCTLLEQTKVGRGSYVVDSILGWESSVGEWCRVEGVTVLGKDVHLKDYLHLNGVKVCPHKSLSQSVSEATIVM